MKISYDGTVLITSQYKKMVDFYKNILSLEVLNDFGNCFAFKDKISIWELKDVYTIAQKLGYLKYPTPNKNLELCFVTDEFDLCVSSIHENQVQLLHDINEEPWGQQTIRFYDPDENLIEIGECFPCFVGRFHRNGLSIEQISEKTGIPADNVKLILEINN